MPPTPPTRRFAILLAIIATITVGSGLILFSPLLLWLLYGDFLSPPPILLPILQFAVAPVLALATGLYQYRRILARNPI